MPLPFLGRQMTASRSRQRVALHASLLFGRGPVPDNPGFLFQAMERREERPRRHREGPTRHLPNPFRNGDAVEGLQFQSPKNEEVERPLKQVRLLVLSRHSRLTAV